jgi:hypothetical protein
VDAAAAAFASAPTATEPSALLDAAASAAFVEAVSPAALSELASALGASVAAASLAAGGSAAAAVRGQVSESPSERALQSKKKADEFDRFTDVSSRF